MDGMEAVIDAPDAIVDTGADIGEPEEVEQPVGGEQQQDKTEGSSYDPRSSKEYTNWLKSLRDSDPATGKFARQAKDDHSRLYQLHQLEPKGIDGIREKYALFDSVVHGELKGSDAVGAMQDELRVVQETDQKIANGDPTALDDLGDDFLPGLTKLAPEMLNRIMAHNSEAAWDAMRPHFVTALQGSPLVEQFNGMVSLFNEQPPAWLPEDRKQAFFEDKMQKLGGFLGKSVEWLNQQFKGAQPSDQRQQPGKQQPPAANEREAAQDKREQEWHWKTNINPHLDKHAEKSFEDQFKAFDKRLRLNPEARAALAGEFVKRVMDKAKANPVYTKQIDRYRGQKNPDANTVLNFAKVEFDRHAKTVMDGLIDERYKSFLNGKPRSAQPPANNGQQQRGPVAPNVKIVTMKPAMDQIDHKGTPLSWLHEKKYKLRDGSVVQVRN